MNRFQKLFTRRPRLRKPNPSRSHPMKPFKRAHKGGWAALDYQEAIAYWTQSQGAR